MEGPLIGFVADVDSDSGIRIASAHLNLDPTTFTDPVAGLPVSETAAEVNTTAEKLLGSLTPEQIDQLIVPEGSTREGLRGADLNETQRELLLEVATTWITVADENAAEARHEELSRTLDETSFAWTGATGEGLSFRVSGPAIYLDYSADPDGPRIYSEFRDPGLIS